MQWLNYHHLFYFWVTARNSSIAGASQELLLAPSTVSTEIKQLEQSLGEELFIRAGRRLSLTEVGQVVFRYAEEIFSLGRELTEVVKGQPTGKPLRLRVGVSNALPKGIDYLLISAAFRQPAPLRVICRADRPERLLADLATHELDVVMLDAPVPADIRVKAFSHRLGECGVGFYARPEDARELRKKFPSSLDQARVLLPTHISSMRANLDHWFESQKLRPVIVGEFDDFALLRVFAEAGQGVFAAPAILDRELRVQYGFEYIGDAAGLRAQFYAVTIAKRIENPAVIAICNAARQKTFTSEIAAAAGN